MSIDGDILRAAADLAERGESFVMLTVTATRGSTPRDPGARMLWQPSKGFTGTVGGGQFEHMALASAQRVFREKGHAAEHYVLGAEAEQCCGGTIDVFIEYIGPRQRVILFGAGHVSEAVVRVVRAAALEIVIADDRPEWNTPERFPGCRAVHRYDEAIALAAEAPASTLVCVMTCSHDTDYELLRGLVALPTPPAFVGLIGSRSKRACLFRRMATAGIAQERIDAVHCPIGLGDMGKEPPLIAVSIAGQLLVESKRLAAL